MKKRLYALALFVLSVLLVPLNSTAQVDLLTTVTQPLSPQAAALGKYVEMPVGYYSGIPEVSVPLYELKTKDFSVPVSLSYHASGVKPREIPGWVGAGFSLNAGGSVTRIVRGLPGLGAAYVPGTFPDRRRMLNVENENSMAKVDTECDEFYFNFLGLSGSFSFTSDGKVLMKDVNNLYAEYTADKFKFIDEKGTEYYFDVSETNTMSSGYTYSSAWYLTRIRLPFKNEVIEFKYESEGNNCYRMNYYPTEQYEFIRYEDRSPQVQFLLNPDCDDVIGVAGLPELIKTNNLLIKSIIHKTDTLKFYRNNSSRTDVYKIRLDSIKMFNGTTMVSRARFTYTYSDSTSDSLAKKMLLDSVNINDEPAYRFSYFGPYMGRKMPGVNNLGTDFWGYYNGEEKSLSPQNQPFFIRFKNLHGTVVNLGSAYNSSFKNPDYKYARVGALKSVSYPTGGKTEFEYEGNDYAYPVVPESDERMAMAMDSLRQLGSSSNYPSTNNSAEFILHQNQTATFETKLGMSPNINSWTDYQNYVYNGGFGALSIARLYKYNEGTGVFDLLNTWSFNPVTGIGAPNPGIGFGFVKPNGTSTQNPSVSLTEGRYKMETEILAYGFSAGIKVTNQFKYKRPGRSQGPFNYHIYNAGGLRIKKITFTSPVNSSSFEKNYDYSYKGITSGVSEIPFCNLTSKIHWGEQRIRYYPPIEGIFDPQICTFFLLNQSTMVPLGNGKGGTVGYAQVTETMNDGRKTVMQFTNGYSDVNADSLFDGYEDQFYFTALGDQSVFDRAGNSKSSWRGRMKRVWYQDGSGKKMKQEVHRFANLASGSLQNTSLFLSINALPGSPDVNYGTSWGTYHFTQDKFVPVLDSAYYFNGTDTLKELTKYSYLNAGFANPSAIVKVNSVGDSSITRFKYPYDYTISGTSSIAFSKGIKNLQDKHVITSPIETYVEEKTAGGSGKVTMAQLVSYKPELPVPDTAYSLNNTAGLNDFSPAVFTVSTASKDNRYERRILFDKYDSYGNVVEQRKEGELKEVLVWGYQKRYIVARITGSTYATVMALVDTTVINNPSGDAAMRTELNKIRTSLASSNPDAEVTSYTYAVLKGMTSMTDPRGETVYYEYDVFGRLKRTKNADNDIKDHLWYHYKP
ncbi:RHS repeat domain-containing protein [Pedobacter sp. FW305-3-2-15-E-R2A2]|uniref:RHS repeat domain-containing protein n=1 Tax=Pedobacter sp. FW305-3-2-15-E-R2A2 TaxID=3140251 RepID=UPI00313FFD37